MVRAAWDDLPHHYAGIELDAFVVMPNHIHGIIVMVGAGFKPAPDFPEGVITALGKAIHRIPAYLCTGP
jgi:hypothetical protein